MMIILPTNNVLNEFHQLACQIDMLDYDLDELIRLVIDALHQPDWYPNSFHEFVKLEEQHCMYNEGEHEHFNLLLWILYDQIHSAFVSTGMYFHGGLQYTYFCTYRGDLIISDEEIPQDFETIPGVN